MTLKYCVILHIKNAEKNVLSNVLTQNAQINVEKNVNHVNCHAKLDASIHNVQRNAIKYVIVNHAIIHVINFCNVVIHVLDIVEKNVHKYVEK